MHVRYPLAALAALLLIAASAADEIDRARAAGATAPPIEARADRRDRRPLSLDEAVELVQRRYAARVLRAEESSDGDALVYRIRLLAADGRVFVVKVNARSGEVE